MILGSHFLTNENLAFHQIIRRIQIFNSSKNVLTSYEQGQISLHSFIWIKLNENKNLFTKTRKILKIKIKNKKVSASKSRKNKYTYIRTTPGRILFNQTIKSFL
jgi:hypothetical protein